MARCSRSGSATSGRCHARSSCPVDDRPIGSQPSARPRRSAPGRPARQPNRATEAVKPCRKLRPPTGPSSPAQNMPATGAGADGRRDHLGVVVGLAEQADAPAVAGEDQRAGGRAGRPAARAGPRRPRRRRAPGTARWRRPRPRRRRRRRRPRGRRRARLRMRKSPRPKSTWCSSMTRPRCRPSRGQGPLVGRRAPSTSSVEPVERGPPGELVDHVALGPGDA